MTEKPEAPAHPECDRLAAKREECQVLSAFLYWLDDEKILLCQATGCDYAPHEQIPENHEKLLATYFDINLATVEKERRALVEWQRKLNEVKAGQVNK